MKLKTLVASVVLALGAQVASADVLNFDDLVGQGAMTTYGGFTWTDWNHYDFAQPPYTPSSGNTRLYDSSNSNSVTSATAFVFDGAMFSGYPDATVRFDLYLGGSLVHTSGTLDPSSAPSFLSSGYSGLIDTVVVVSDRPDFFVMDDFTFNGNTAPVPEPETYALTMAGLAIVGVVARRRQRKSV